MTGIEGVGGPTSSRIGRRIAAPHRNGFALPSEPGTVEHPVATLAPQPASLDSMLTLQEFGGETVQDREARRGGQAMLAALAALQRGLLSGGDAAATLERLAELASAVPLATDRRLAALLSAIVVRVRVELARQQF
jgi:hypothetical protein